VSESLRIGTESALDPVAALLVVAFLVGITYLLTLVRDIGDTA